MDLQRYTLRDITDTHGAASRLSMRFGHTVGVERVRQFVKSNRLRSFLFVEGMLQERKPGADTRGKDLIFLLIDLDALNEPVAGYPKGKPRK